VNKKPRFFCDNCNTEVGRDTKACPQCGRFFASIRCPSCGFTGEEKAFTGGCPSCGYSAPPKVEKGDVRAKAAAPRASKKKFPLWAYVLCICASVFVFMLLLFNLMR